MIGRDHESQELIVPNRDVRGTEADDELSSKTGTSRGAAVEAWGRAGSLIKDAGDTRLEIVSCLKL